jgi:hypothetical protein
LFAIGLYAPLLYRWGRRRWQIRAGRQIRKREEKVVDQDGGGEGGKSGQGDQDEGGESGRLGWGRRRWQIRGRGQIRMREEKVADQVGGGEGGKSGWGRRRWQIRMGEGRTVDGRKGS